MSLDVVPVTAGSAHAALAAAVTEAKDGEVLRPVTVLVPTNAAGVIARRTLGRLGGVAAVDFLTLGRLAERIAGPALRAEQRLPVSTAVVDLAVRWVLANTTTSFDAVAEHPSTVVALRDLYRELRLAGGQAVDRLANASRRGREVARICRLVADRLAPSWYDEGDLLIHAVAAVGAGVSRRCRVPCCSSRSRSVRSRSTSSGRSAIKVRCVCCSGSRATPLPTTTS